MGLRDSLADPRIALWVTSTNAPATGRYERCGFVATGETEPLPHTPSLNELRMDVGARC